MANTRELRRRIRSTKNTSQITKAMQMVSAVKMKRAQDQALNGRPYNENLSSALARLLPKIEVKAHLLLAGNDSKRIGVILLSTDKGLCGALNTNLFRAVLSAQFDTDTVFYTVGKKGRNLITKTGKDLMADFDNLDTVSFRQAVLLTKLIKESFLTGEVGQVFLVYPHFMSTIKQEPRVEKLLPVEVGVQNVELGVKKSEFLFEPNVDALLDALLVHEVQTKIYQALLETKASEHSARMVAMKNATDNAKELVEDLTLNYNQVRQDSITREILEISSAAAAMQ